MINQLRYFNKVTNWRASNWLIWILSFPLQKPFAL